MPWQESAIYTYERKWNLRCVANLHCECQELKPKVEINTSFLVLHPSSDVDTVKTVGSHLKFISSAAAIDDTERFCREMIIILFLTWKTVKSKLFKKRKVRQVDVTIKIPRVSTIMSLCSENYKSFERCIKTEKINQLSSFYYTYRDTALSMIYTEEDQLYSCKTNTLKF